VVRHFINYFRKLKEELVPSELLLNQGYISNIKSKTIEYPRRVTRSSEWVKMQCSEWQLYQRKPCLLNKRAKKASEVPVDIETVSVLRCALMSVHAHWMI